MLPHRNMCHEATKSRFLASKIIPTMIYSAPSLKFIDLLIYIYMQDREAFHPATTLKRAIPVDQSLHDRS